MNFLFCTKLTRWSQQARLMYWLIWKGSDNASPKLCRGDETETLTNMRLFYRNQKTRSFHLEIPGAILEAQQATQYLVSGNGEVVGGEDASRCWVCLRLHIKSSLWCGMLDSCRKYQSNSWWVWTYCLRTYTCRTSIINRNKCPRSFTVAIRLRWAHQCSKR